jgi:hypothetical protein
MDHKTSYVNSWNVSESQETLRQVADLCVQAFGLPVTLAPDFSAFASGRTDKSPPRGILAYHGRLVENDCIILECELFQGPPDLRVSSKALFEHLSAVGEKVRPVSPREQPTGEVTYLVTLKIKATPLSMTRASALVDELKHLDRLARTLQAEVPVVLSAAELAKLYQPVAEFLDPVPGWPGPEAESGPWGDWAGDAVDYLLGSSCLAVAAPLPLQGDFALGVLSLAVQRFKQTLGKVKLSAINARTLVELTQKAPGIVALPAMSLSLGTSPYELGNEMRALLSTLSAQNRPVVFIGALAELQAVFHGGQGGQTDPLVPVVSHVPEVPLESLALFAVRTSGLPAGGLPAGSEERLLHRVLAELSPLPPPEQQRVLPVVARRAVNAWAASGAMVVESAFAAKASGLSETLAGLSPRPRVGRPPATQEQLVRRLTDAALSEFFKENLLGQDAALDQVCLRLASEVLTRPPHQPLRYCAQGTPATGKSESAVLLADWLGIPYINIDAASMPSSHTAASQLLGSGRGIVGSHQSGRLEQAAKHHAGAVIEVSDLDHAVPEVRAAMADLFLQVLETGEAQSATGAMFSCAGLIFAFTMNLPGGQDEKVHRGIGFQNKPDAREVRQRVVSELKIMLSGAFLSRIGTPILFLPLEGEALAAILSRALKKALLAAAKRLHLGIQEVVLGPKTASLVLASLDTSVTAFGARTVLEHGRALAARAILDLKRRGGDPSGKVVEVLATSQGELTLHIR